MLTKSFVLSVFQRGELICLRTGVWHAALWSDHRCTKCNSFTVQKTFDPFLTNLMNTSAHRTDKAIENGFA